MTHADLKDNWQTHAVIPFKVIKVSRLARGLGTALANHNNCHNGGNETHECHASGQRYCQLRA